MKHYCMSILMCPLHWCKVHKLFSFSKVNLTFSQDSICRANEPVTKGRSKNQSSSNALKMFIAFPFDIAFDIAF